jgi:hypothetical protein
MRISKTARRFIIESNLRTTSRHASRVVSIPFYNLVFVREDFDLSQLQSPTDERLDFFFARKILFLGYLNGDLR